MFDSLFSERGLSLDRLKVLLEVRDAVIAVGMARGAEETFDRLAELLPTLG